MVEWAGAEGPGPSGINSAILPGNAVPQPVDTVNVKIILRPEIQCLLVQRN